MKSQFKKNKSNLLIIVLGIIIIICPNIIVHMNSDIVSMYGAISFDIRYIVKATIITLSFILGAIITGIGIYKILK